MRRRLVLGAVVVGVMATAALPSTAAAQSFLVFIILSSGDSGPSCQLVLRADAPQPVGGLQARVPCSRLAGDIVPPEPVHATVVVGVSCDASGLSAELVAAGRPGLPVEVWNQPLRGFSLPALCGRDRGNPPDDSLMNVLPGRLRGGA